MEMINGMKMGSVILILFLVMEDLYPTEHHWEAITILSVLLLWSGSFRFVKS